jgi:plasmid maintenance system antidote protein VapI
MKKTLFDELVSSPEDMRLYQQEKLILDCTELICEQMEKQEITKTELAKRLGRTKGYITQLLDGRANMTLRTISDMMWALDCGLEVSASALNVSDDSDYSCYQIEDSSKALQQTTYEFPHMEPDCQPDQALRKQQRLAG